MDHLQNIVPGIALTVILTAASFLLGAIGGIPLLLMRRSRLLLLRVLARSLVEVLRGVPPLVWLFIVYFGIGSSVVQLDPLTSAIVGLSVITAAYLSEIYRAGISAIDAGQWDAAHALRLESRAIWLRVIGPQLVRISLPAATTWAVGLLKDTSIASTIGVTEILYYAKNDASETVSPLIPFVWAGVLYVILTVPLALVSRAADQRLRQRVAR